MHIRLNLTFNKKNKTVHILNQILKISPVESLTENSRKLEENYFKIKAPNLRQYWFHQCI